MIKVCLMVIGALMFVSVIFGDGDSGSNLDNDSGYSDEEYCAALSLSGASGDVESAVEHDMNC